MEKPRQYKSHKSVKSIKQTINLELFAYFTGFLLTFTVLCQRMATSTDFATFYGRKTMQVTDFYGDYCSLGNPAISWY
jgi:hypothetical protein